jgi:hypothetical protein
MKARGVLVVQTGAIFEVAPTEVQFPFAGLELKSTGTGPLVAFEMTMPPQ